MHAAWLGPSGLVDLAEDCVTRANDLAARLDEVVGVQAPVHDGHHFREFVAHTDQPARAVVEDLAAEGYAIHAIDEHLIQVSTTEVTAEAADGLVGAIAEVAK